MRKRISSHPQRESALANTDWLDLEALAESKSPRKTRRIRSNRRCCLLAQQDGAQKARENRRSASSSKRRSGSGVSACCFENRSTRVHRSWCCAGHQRETVYCATSCASSITSVHREPLRKSRNFESSWKTWLSWNLQSSRT